MPGTDQAMEFASHFVIRMYLCRSDRAQPRLLVAFERHSLIDEYFRTATKGLTAITHLCLGPGSYSRTHLRSPGHGAVAKAAPRTAPHWRCRFAYGCQ